MEGSASLGEGRGREYSLRTHSKELLRLRWNPGLPTPGADLQALCYCRGVPGAPPGAPTPRLGRRLQHGTGWGSLIAQSPAAWRFSLPPSTPGIHQRPWKLSSGGGKGVNSHGGRASAPKGSSCPGDPGPPLQDLPARRQAARAHFPLSAPGLRAFLGDMGSPSPAPPLASLPTLLSGTPWGQCAAWESGHLGPNPTLEPRRQTSAGSGPASFSQHWSHRTPTPLEDQMGGAGLPRGSLVPWPRKRASRSWLGVTGAAEETPGPHGTDTCSTPHLSAKLTQVCSGDQGSPQPGHSRDFVSPSQLP